MKELNNISLPKNIRNITIETVEKAERDKKRKKRNKKNIIIASTISIIILGSSIDINSVRANIEGLTNKIETYFDDTLKTEPIKDYKASLGITSENNGVKITLNEFFMDNETMYINTKIHSKDGRKIAEDANKRIFLNGKECVGAGVNGRTWVKNKDKSSDILFLKDIEKVDLKSIKDIKIIFDSVTYYNWFGKQSTVKGNWEFSFKFDGEKAASQIIDKELNETIKINNTNMTIKSIKVSPMKVTVKYKFDKKHSDEDISDIDVGVLDKTGKEVIFSNGGGDLNEITANAMVDTSGMDEITLVPINLMERYEFKDKAIKVKLK